MANEFSPLPNMVNGLNYVVKYFVCRYINLFQHQIGNAEIYEVRAQPAEAQADRGTNTGPVLPKEYCSHQTQSTRAETRHGYEDTCIWFASSTGMITIYFD